MSEALTLVAFLSELTAIDVTVQRSDATLAVAVVDLHGDRRLLAIERTYREGIRIIMDPTEDEVRTAEDGDLWEIWNSRRARLLYSVV